MSSGNTLNDTAAAIKDDAVATLADCRHRHERLRDVRDLEKYLGGCASFRVGLQSLLTEVFNLMLTCRSIFLTSC